MLTHPAPEGRRARPPLSLRQEYEDFILQRIEDFKEQLTREQLLGVADEAVRELEVGPEGQLVLTEVLVLEHVDRLIMRRLKLPTYRRWRERHMRIRRAQQDPTHWGLEADTPLPELAGRLEADDLALVVGASAAPAAFYLAAHDASVLVIDNVLAAIEGIESRASTEALAMRIQAMVVALGDWFPDVSAALVVVDAAALAGLDATTRVRLLDGLRAHTAPGGVHVILPPEPRAGVISLAPDALQTHYAGWRVERGLKGSSRWFLAAKP